MTVYSSSMINAIQNTLTTLAQNYIGKTRLHLTDDEFVGAFINPDHIASLRQVEEIAGLIGNMTQETVLPSPDGGSFSVSVAFSGTMPSIVPRYVSGGIQPTCPDHVRDKILAWTEERYRIGSAVGDAFDAIQALNYSCGDAEALTLMLPCFPTLLGRVDQREDNRTTKRARKLTTVGRFGKLPALPRQVKQRLLEVSAIVNSFTLVLDAPDQTAPRRHALLAVRNLRGSQRQNIFVAPDSGASALATFV